MRKAYISGPIKGIENATANFAVAASQVTEAGYEVVNPFNVAPICATGCTKMESDEHYDHYLRGDLAAMLGCDVVVTLDGWRKSRGARLEVGVAIAVGIPVVELLEVLYP